MGDDIKSLAVRVQKLETQLKGTDSSITELERKGKYLDGVLDAQNKLLERMAAAERRLDDLQKRLSTMGNK